MNIEDEREFIGCNLVIKLRAKIGNEMFTKDKIYEAKSESKTESGMYTQYMVIDDKKQSHIVTVKLLTKYFLIVIDGVK